MTFYAYDGADPTFDLKAAKANGGIICSVYIVGSPGGMAHANAQRVKDILAAGMGVLPNWERAADFFSTATLTQCKAAGQEAAAACKALGFPSDGTIGVAFSFDFEVPRWRYDEMVDKLHAVQAGLGTAYRAVGYAQSELIEHFAAKGLPGPHWLMMSTFGETYLTNSPHVFMWQMVGNDPVPSTDRSVVTQPDKAPVLWPAGSSFGAKPMPVNDLPTTGEWAIQFSNSENGVKRTAAGWLMRVVQQLNELINAVNAVKADTAAIRKKLGA